jgi:hypothetical protein
MESESSKKPAASKPLPFKVIRMEKGGEAMKNWTPTEVDGGWRYAGRCPRCDHPSEKFIPVAGVVLKLAMAVEPPRRRVYQVHCTCAEPHPDRPAGEKGCGAYWGAEFEIEGLKRREGAS